MTPDNRAKLLQALCFAIQAEQDGISDLLQDVILGEMDGGHKVPILRGINDSTTIEPPWNVMLCDAPTKTPTKVDE